MNINEIILESNKKFLSKKSFIKFYPKEYEYILANTKFLPEDASFSERKYCILNNINQRLKCPICNDNFLKFCNFTEGYKNVCSKKCYSTSQSNIIKNIWKSNKIDLNKRLIKTRETKLQKYGNDKYQNMEKIRQTKNERYGNPNYINLEKRNQTFKNKSIIEKNKIKEKRKQTFLKKYGSNSYSEKDIIHYEQYIDDNKFKQIIKKEKYIVNNICNYFNIKGLTTIYKRIHSIGMGNIFKTLSHYEDDIEKFLKDNNIIIERNKRIYLDNQYEIDLYLPVYKIGIEFNGNYWHSDINKDERYHQEKSLLAESKGIRLIHIFEYEYNKDPDKILNWLLSQIKQDNVIYARKCIIKEIDNEISNKFLNKYHLQNSCNAYIKIGLFYNDELVEVITFGKPRFSKRYDYELIRLCTRFNYKVIGGASKLFKYFIKHYNSESIISYQNFSKFNGNVYSNLRFKYKELSSPNYVYVKGDEVLSRYQCQKHKLIKKYPKYNNLTESEIMYNLDYLKIYDSGNKVWLWNKKEEI